MRRSETWTPTWSITGRSWTPPRGCCSRWELPSGSACLIGAGAGSQNSHSASDWCLKNSSGAAEPLGPGDPEAGAAHRGVQPEAEAGGGGPRPPRRRGNPDPTAPALSAPRLPSSHAELPVLCDSGSWQPLTLCFGVAEGPSHSGGEQREPDEAEGASRLPAAASCLPRTIWF